MPAPKPVQLKKTAAKTQLKPELKDAKLKKAKKLSSKSSLSESFKRHQEAKKETGGADENGVSFEVEVINSVAYIPGLATTTVRQLRHPPVVGSYAAPAGNFQKLMADSVFVAQKT